MAYWAAAQVQSSLAGRAKWHVERQGFETYMPLCQPSRRSTRVVPLFVGYLFVSVVDHWHCLLGTYGVLNVIRSGDVPFLIPGARRRMCFDGPGYHPHRAPGNH
jgi:Transcription termination factor nusG